MKEVLLIDCGNYNSVTTVQINYIKCLLRENYKIKYVIFQDGNKVDEIKFQRWPQHDNLIYVEIKANKRVYQFLRKVIGVILTNYLLLRRILKQVDHAICFEYYSAAPVFIHSFLSNNFNYQIASLELYNTQSLLVKRAFQNANLVTTQDELRKQQIEKYYCISKPSNTDILYNSSLSFEEITIDKIEVPQRIQNQMKLLFIGSLISEHCIEEVIDWVEEIPENNCIIFHGWGLSPKNRLKIERLEELYPHKVWLSQLILNEKDKWKMYNIADFGIVMFNKNHRNNEFAGLSAGKLFDFIRAGVPVIASDSKLLSQYILENNLGFVFSKVNFIENLNSKQVFSGKWEEFSFDKKFYKVINCLEK